MAISGVLLEEKEHKKTLIPSPTVKGREFVVHYFCFYTNSRGTTLIVFFLRREITALGTSWLQRCNEDARPLVSGSFAAWEPSTSPTCGSCHFLWRAAHEGGSEEACPSGLPPNAGSLLAAKFLIQPETLFGRSQCCALIRLKGSTSYFFGHHGSVCILLLA